MTTPFMGEIRMFAGTVAPAGWALCHGQILNIAPDFSALFSLLGTKYGGDGRTTFGLPDLRGRIPIHEGFGPGLSNRRMGEKGGSERVIVTTAQLPAHTHAARAVSGIGDSNDPSGRVWAKVSSGLEYTTDPPDAGQSVNSAAVSTADGGGQDHNNLMPTLCINFIIALAGVYPSRS